MNEELRIRVLPVRQQIGTFYVGTAPAQAVLAACEFDFRRIEERGGYKDFLGIQRELKEPRVRQIAKYVGTIDSVFPTSVVLSVDQRCASFEEDPCGGLTLVLRPFVDEVDPGLSIPYHDIFSIIDGQHRLKAFELVGNSVEFDLSLSIFIDVDDATEADIFSTVNLTQTKVNKSLVYDLFSLANSRSPEKTCHEIVVNLDRLDESPFKGRIKRLGTATEGRFGETLSQATIVKGLLAYITNDPLLDRDRGKRVGFWDEISERQAQKRIFFELFRTGQDAKILRIVLNYFQAIQARWPAAWEGTGRGNIIARTNGFNAFARYLRPAYLHFTQSSDVVTSSQFLSLLSEVRLTDGDFNSKRFLPGSSGAKALYETLMSDSRL